MLVIHMSIVNPMCSCAAGLVPAVGAGGGASMSSGGPGACNGMCTHDTIMVC